MPKTIVTNLTLALAIALALFVVVAPPTSAAAAAWNTSEICGSNDWTYQPMAGLCLSAVSVDSSSSQQLVTRQAAAVRCKLLGGELPDPTEDYELYGLEVFTSERAMASKFWTGAVRSSPSAFHYEATNASVPDSFWLEGGRPNETDGDCAVFSATLNLVGSDWTSEVGLETAGCTERRAAVCSMRVSKCDSSQLAASCPNIRAENVSSGRLLINVFNIGLRQQLQCADGYFRARDSPTGSLPTPSATADGMQVNEAECGYSMVGGRVQNKWRLGTFENCAMTTCATEPLKTELIIPNVEDYASTLTQSYYNFSDFFLVNCSRGYVSYSDEAATIGRVTCGQNSYDPTTDEWQPADLNTCKAVACPSLSTITNDNTVAYKAVNRVKQQEYNEFQRSSFAYFPNRVHIKCKETGYFFEDRTFEKTAQCDLMNTSLIEGAWIGTLGTSISRLPDEQCTAVTCLSDDLIAKTDEGSELLASLNYKNLTTITLNNGTVYSLAASKFNSQQLYDYNTIVAFACASGSSTGVGQPIALCTSSGSWNVSSLPTCTRESEQITATGKHYTPPAVEAQDANSIGAMAITICIIFAVSIVILDLSTLSRDLSLFRRNLRRLSDRLMVTRPVA